MAYSKTVFIGRLTRDPELKVTQAGKSVVNFTVAVDRRNSKEKTADFWDCVAWNAQAEAISKYFYKGKEILVEGEMHKRSYTDKDGNKRWAVELQVATFAFTGNKEQTTQEPSSQFEDLQEPDDELPF